MARNLLIIVLFCISFHLKSYVINNILRFFMFWMPTFNLHPYLNGFKICINYIKSTHEIIPNTLLPICKEIITSMINQQLHVHAVYLLNGKSIFVISPSSSAADKRIVNYNQKNAHSFFDFIMVCEQPLSFKIFILAEETVSLC